MTVYSKRIRDVFDKIQTHAGRGVAVILTAQETVCLSTVVGLSSDEHYPVIQTVAEIVGVDPADIETGKRERNKYLIATARAVCATLLRERGLTLQQVGARCGYGLGGNFKSAHCGVLLAIKWIKSKPQYWPILAEAKKRLESLPASERKVVG